MKEIRREQFLTDSARALLALGGFGLLSNGIFQLAFAAQESEPILLHIFLRGGCDGLSFVAPLSGENRRIYEAERPTVRLELSGDNALLPLNDSLGFHPAAKALLGLYKAKKLSVVHGFGLTANTRSHFDAQNMMDLGFAEKKISSTGWITRFLQQKNTASALLPAIASSSLLPSSLLGFERAISVADIRRLDLGGRKNLDKEQTDTLAALYDLGNSWIHQHGREALSSLRILQSSSSKPIQNSKLAYPKSDIANRLATLSNLLKMDLGLSMATVDMGGWDTHKYQGAGKDGSFGRQVQQLSEGIDAFLQDIESTRPDISKRLTVLVYSEFGRRLRENANRGTDHGHGGICFALGAGVNGGKVAGKWPGLQPEHLYERADVAVTTDYREILSEYLGKQAKIKSTEKIFPGFKPLNELHLFS